MISRINGGLWTGDGGGEDDAVSLSRPNASSSDGRRVWECKEGEELSLNGLKSMLEDDWYMAVAADDHGFEAFQAEQDYKGVAFLSNPSSHEALLLSPLVEDLDRNQSFFSSKSALSPLFDAANPLDAGFGTPGFLPAAASSNSTVLMNRGGDGGGGSMLGFVGTETGEQHGCPELKPGSKFSSGCPLPPAEIGFDNFENAPYLRRSKVLWSLEMLPPEGSQPTLPQKLAEQQKLAVVTEKDGFLGPWASTSGCQRTSGTAVLEESARDRKANEDNVDYSAINGSGLNYNSDDTAGDNAKNGGSGRGNNSNGDGMVTGGENQKGKKKKQGLPAKNLMAERRRRKKLNDRLYMLRSVVPKISKMDRASILGDAIEYLKELHQRINDLQNELETTPASSSLPSATMASFHTLTPTLSTLKCHMKDELCLSSLPSPNCQSVRVEVREREGRAVNIHMFCSRKPGQLLSAMRALDDLGLDIQQAVISCFNGFALDVFRAEQCKEPGVPTEEIKTVLLHSAGV